MLINIPEQSNALYVFIDESGNFDFASSGTRHFVMAAVITASPLASAAVLHSLRYKLLAEGRDVSSFHATEDRQDIRDQVFRSLRNIDEVTTHVFYCDKRIAHRTVQSGAELHSVFGRKIIEFVIGQFSTGNHDSIVIVFDNALTRKTQDNFLKVLYPTLKLTVKPFHVFFQRMLTDMNGQIADYLAWSKFVQLERGEERPWKSLGLTLKPTEARLFDS